MSIFINGIDRTPVNSLVLLNAAAGNEVANRMDYTVNKAADNDTGFVINKTDILSSGTSLIIDFQKNGTSLLTLDNRGQVINTITLNAATGNEAALTLNYTTNKLTSGNDTGLLINMTDTLSPGTSYLANFQTGGVNKCAVRNDGYVYATGFVAADVISAANGFIASTNTTLYINGGNQSIANMTVIEATRGTYTNSSGYLYGFSLIPIYNQSGTASATDFLINRTETAVGSGAQLLIDAQVGGVSRKKVTNKGITGHSPIDAAAVAPTNPVNTFFYNASKNDDTVITCPAITTSGYGVVILGTAEEYARFIVDSVGTVTLLDNSANVVANADTDTKLCIGTAATQEPLQIKNRLGGTKVLNVMMWYD